MQDRLFGKCYDVQVASVGRAAARSSCAGVGPLDTGGKSVCGSSLHPKGSMHCCDCR